MSHDIEMGSKIETCRAIFKDIDQAVKDLCNTLRDMTIRSTSYTLAAVDKKTYQCKRESEHKNSIAHLQQALNHYKVGYETDVKLVVRYPGIVNIVKAAHFEIAADKIRTVNEHKKRMLTFLQNNGKPTTITDSKGTQFYTQNNVLFHALPMHNTNMITRSIQVIEEPIKEAVFRWNIDYYTYKTSASEIKDRLNAQYNQLPLSEEVTIQQWRYAIEKAIKLIDVYTSMGFGFKDMPPKPILPVMRLKKKALGAISLKPSLPVFIHEPEGLKIRKTLPLPPEHPIIAKSTAKTEYIQISPFHAYYAFSQLRPV